MAAPAIIKATFSDYRRVRGRKVGQLVFEVPLEQLHDAIAGLGGEPSIENDTWVAIARLEGDGTSVIETAEKWKPEYQHPAKACALLCQKQTFWEFVAVQTFGKRQCENEADAAEYVRHKCGVNTRADFATNPVALRKWQALESAYLAWLPEAA